jgi:hypothetical protein
MMTWSPENKKHHLQPTIHRTLRNPFTSYYDPKDLGMLYIPPPPPQRHPPVIHSPVPTHPIQSMAPIQQSMAHQQQPMHQLQPNDALFDVDLEDWNSPPVNPLHAQFPPTHSHSHTHSISLALPQYPAPRVKREDLPAFTGYHASAHYDLSGVPIQNHDPSSTYVHQQQQQQVSPPTTNGTYYSPPFTTQQHQQIHHHPQQQQQNYVVPAELSPTSPVSSSSPLSPRYADLSHNNAVVCDPRFVSGSHEDMLLKGMLLGAGDDPAAETWHGERRCSLTSLESEAEEGDRDAEGDMVDADADGEDDWEHQHQQQPAVYDQQPPQQREDAGEEEVPEDEESEEEKEDDYYEDDEESVDDDDNDGEFVLRTRRRRANTSSAVYPSSYPYTTEGRNLRSRASSRYNPYPSYAGSSASDNGTASYSEDNTSSRRRLSTSSPPLSPSASFPTRTLTSNKTHANRARSSSSTTLPVPVPNLTKKSRGRRVPTVSSLEDLRSVASGAGKKRQGAGGKSARMYLCDVEGCGKCFARGEHLKRHVRSIHTYEKREFLVLLFFLGREGKLMNG